MDTLIAGLLSSPLAMVLIVLACAAMIAVGYFYVYPELKAKSDLQDQYDKLSKAYKENLELQAEKLTKVNKLLDDGLDLSELSAAIDRLEGMNQSELLKSIEDIVLNILELQKTHIAEMRVVVTRVEDHLQSIKSDHAGDFRKQLSLLESVSRDCSDIIRRHDVITGALLQRLTHDGSSNINLETLR